MGGLAPTVGGQGCRSKVQVGGRMEGWMEGARVVPWGVSSHCPAQRLHARLQPPPSWAGAGPGALGKEGAGSLDQAPALCCGAAAAGRGPRSRRGRC